MRYLGRKICKDNDVNDLSGKKLSEWEDEVSKVAIVLRDVTGYCEQKSAFSAYKYKGELTRVYFTDGTFFDIIESFDNFDKIFNSYETTISNIKRN